MLIRSVRLALVLCVLAPVAAARAASLWTPVTSGTTSGIAAIAAPNANEVVYATKNGEIHHLTGGTFAASTVSPAKPPFGFSDLAMSPSGTTGVAVGPGGSIYRSVDSGATWNRVTGTQEYTATGCGSASSLAALSDDLFSVHFADATTVYITGDHDDVLKSTDGGATFSEVNRAANGSCKINPNEPLTDTGWLDATHGFLISSYFGSFYATSDGLASPVSADKGEALNSYGTSARIALDSNNPQEAWATAGFASCGTLCLQLTQNGGTTWNAVNFDGHQTAFRSIAASGTTVVVVGDAGDIYTSPDGTTFFRQVAAAPSNTTNWSAVALVPGTNAAWVGGDGGALLRTSTANAIPDTTAPTGSITGPKSLAPKQFGTYAAHVTDNPGGSGVDPSSYVWSTTGLPTQTGKATATFAFSTNGVHTITVSFKDLAGNAGSASIDVTVALASGVGTSGGTTTTTGGTTIVIWKKVTISGHKGRYIPVKLSTKKPRRFVVSLQTTAKHPKTLAKLTATLRKGKKTVKLGVPKRVKAGSYRLVVQVFTTGKHGHRVGRSVKQVFVLV